MTGMSVLLRLAMILNCTDHLPLLLHGIFCCSSRLEYILPFGVCPSFGANCFHFQWLSPETYLQSALEASGAHCPHGQRARGCQAIALHQGIPSQWLEVTGLWRASLVSVSTIQISIILQGLLWDKLPSQNFAWNCTFTWVLPIPCPDSPLPY